MSVKNSSENIGNLTRNLPVCSAVPQPSAQLRVPFNGDQAQSVRHNDHTRNLFFLKRKEKHARANSIETASQLRTLVLEPQGFVHCYVSFYCSVIKKILFKNPVKAF
jgi:hypothetical protein